MSDFETRVREALNTGAEGAPAPVGLADAARTRMRRRRRNTTGVLAAAFLVAAIPVGLAVVNAGDDGGDRRTGTVGVEDAPAGTQAYSYLDATVLVPAEWRSAGRYIEGDWCNGAQRPLDSPVGYVGVHDMRTQIGCLDDEPLSNYEPFASFSAQRQGPVRAERDGWVTENVQIGHAWLTLRYDDPAVGQEIKESARVIDVQDPNGCEPRTDAMSDDTWRPAAVFDLVDADVDRVSACGHMNILSGNQGPTLSSSASFTGNAARELVDLILAQPETAPTEENCFASAAAVWVLSVHDGEDVQQVLVRRDYCHGLGTDDGTTYRQDSYEVNAWLELGEPVQLSDDPDAPVSSGSGVDGAPLDPDRAQAPDSQGGGSQGYAGE